MSSVLTEKKLAVHKNRLDLDFSFIQLDLVNFTSVRDFVRNFQESNKSLFALVNNAGIMKAMQGTDKELTEDGFEITMAANYLGTCPNNLSTSLRIRLE